MTNRNESQTYDIEVTSHTEQKSDYNIEKTEQFVLKPAGFWVRFWAYLIDIIIIWSISSIVIYPVFKIFGWDFQGTTWYAPIGFITSFIFYLYFVLMTYLFKQTVGKMIFGLRVISIKQEELSIPTILFREWIGRFFSATILPLYWIIGFTPNKQGLHDFITDTMVVHEHSYEKKVLTNNKRIDSSSKLQESNMV